MVKEVELTNTNKVALVDDEDFQLASQYTWWYNDGYVRSEKNNIGVKIHRLVTGVTDPTIEVDHKNHDTFDNQKTNLRVCTRQQNQFNKLPLKNSSSKYKGVFWHKATSKWMVSITCDGHTLYLGLYNAEEEAACVYDDKAREMFGEFAYLNFPDVKNKVRRNVLVEKNKSGFRGVHFAKNSWCASINHNNKKYHIGYFASPVDAAIAYDERAIELKGEKAILNFDAKNYLNESN